MRFFLRKLLYYSWLIAIVIGMIPGFLSVSLFHAKKLLKEENEDDKRAGKLFMIWSTIWAALIYSIFAYVI